MQENPDSHNLVQSVINLIRTHSDPQIMLSKLASHLGERFQADICLIIADTQPVDTMPMGFWSQKNCSDWTSKLTEQLFSLSFVEKILKEKQPIDITNVLNHSRDKELCQLLSVQSVLAIQTQFHGCANGLILLGIRQPHQWTNQEINLGKIIAEPMALACSIAQQKTQTSEEDSFNLGPPTLPRNNLLTKWYQMTHQQLEQQKQLNELKDEIITTISHEAGTPLASMKLAIQMLSERQDSLSPESKGQYWTILKQEWQRLNDLITNIKTLQRLKARDLPYNPQQVDLNFTFNEIVQSFRSEWHNDRRKKLTLVTQGLINNHKEGADPSLMLYTDPQHFKSILVELLINAGKFATPETTVFLKVTRQGRLKNKKLVISVTNTGLGISPEEREYIFEPFRRGQGMTDKAIPGTGLGLTLVKGLLELLHGKIEMVSEPTDKPDRYHTCVTITLPES